MARFIMAGLLIASCVVPARAEYGATVGVNYVDLDTKGHRGQVQEYDGALYKGAHGNVSVSNQGAYGLFDFSLLNIGSTEEEGAFAADYKSGFRISGKHQTMHHRMNYMHTAQIHNGVWVTKSDLAPIVHRAPIVTEVVMRRSESELNIGFVSPEDSARFVNAQYWNVDKFGTRWWYWPKSGNYFQDGPVKIDNQKRDLTLGFGTNLAERGALSVDVVRSEYEDNAPKVPAVGAGTGSRNPGDFVKRPDARQSMTGTEFKFRHNVSKDFAVTGAFTGRQRQNMNTEYKFNAVVGSLNAAYRASSKLSLLGKLYVRAYQIDENSGYQPRVETPGSDAHSDVMLNQIDKTTVRGEFILNYRPVEKVNVKAAYKLEVTNRRDAPTQAYTADRYFRDNYYLNGTALNAAAHNDTRHTFTLDTKAELPLGIEAEAGYKRLQANRPAFINQANKQDDFNGSLTVPLPKDVSLTLTSGFLREKNTVSNFSHFKRTQNTYRAGLDWAANNKTFVGADFSYEATRYFSELYLGSGGATEWFDTFHASAMNRQINTVYGVHGKVILPKGLVVLGNGSYTRSTITTPLRYVFASGANMLNDFTPSNVNIARGSLALEYTPESFKTLTARASYAVSHWVDKFDELNSGRASVAQLGVSAKF